MVKLSEIPDKQLDPRELQYRLNNKIRKTINKCLNQDDPVSDEGVDPADRANKDSARNKLASIMDREEGNKQMIPYDDLTEIHKCLQHLDPSYDLFFYQLLEETNTIVPTSTKSPELRARLSKLKCEAAAKEYRSMTDGVHLVPSNSKENQGNKVNEIRQIKTLITALINGVMVVFCSFFFVYKAVEYSLPQPNINIQILVAIIVTSIIAIAELYFFIRVM